MVLRADLSQTRASGVLDWVWMGLVVITLVVSIAGLQSSQSSFLEIILQVLGQVKVDEVICGNKVSWGAFICCKNFSLNSSCPN